MRYENGYNDYRLPLVKRGKKAYRASSTGMGYREWDENLSEYEKALLRKMEDERKKK